MAFKVLSNPKCLQSGSCWSWRSLDHRDLLPTQAYQRDATHASSNSGSLGYDSLCTDPNLSQIINYITSNHPLYRVGNRGVAPRYAAVRAKNPCSLPLGLRLPIMFHID